MSTILVTGAAGFIGSHLCERLLAAEHRVIGLDNFNDYYAPALKRANLETCLTHPHFQIIEGDIRDAALLDPIFEQANFEHVVHLAAMAGVRNSILQPLLYADVNIQGTLNLAELARAHMVPYFVFGSSSSVYGANPSIPFTETDRLDALLSPYAATKLAGEILLKNYSDLFQINVTALRFFTVYGPRQRPEMAIHGFTRKILRGEPIDRFGDGYSLRDYTYIDDIIDGILLAMAKPARFEIYNLGAGQTIALAEMIGLLEGYCGQRAKIQGSAEQPGDAPRTLADIAKARKQLGYEPKVNVRTGLGRFVEWYQKTHRADS